MKRTLAEWSDPRISASEWGEIQKSNPRSITSYDRLVIGAVHLFVAIPVELTRCTHAASRSASPAHRLTETHKQRHSLLLSTCIRSTVRAHPLGSRRRRHVPVSLKSDIVERLANHRARADGSTRVRRNQFSCAHRRGRCYRLKALESNSCQFQEVMCNTTCRTPVSTITGVGARCPIYLCVRSRSFRVVTQHRP
jgi:hypothetical protein